MKLYEISLIDKAKDLAMLIHADQKRRSNNKPYFIHPFRVYQRAKSLGLTKDAQIIALLHDAYEDSKDKDKTIYEIKRNFGEKVLYFIVLLSHDNLSNYNEYILNLAKKSELALQIKLLDMLENINDNPTEKQKNKYLNAIEYLINHNINIDKKILDQFKKF